MKKTFTFLTALSMGLWLTPLSAQTINSPLIASFETDQDNPFNFSFDSLDGTIAVGNNPATDGVNQTLKCAVYSNTTGAGQNWWGKIYMNTKEGFTIVPASANHRYLHFYAYTTSDNLNCEFAVKDPAGNIIKQMAYSLHEKNKWEKVTIDLGSSMAGKSIGMFYFMPSSGGMQPNEQYMVDEIILSDIAGERYSEPVLATFEAGTKQLFDLNIDGGSLTIVDNDLKSGINTSDKCIVADYPGGSDWWHKLKLETKADFVIEPQTANHKYLHFMSYRTITNGMCMEIQNKAGELIYKKNFAPTMTNAWEEIVLDLTQSEEDKPGITGQNIGKIWIYPAAGGGPVGQYRFDQFILSDTNAPTGEVRVVNNWADFETDEWKNNIASIATQVPNATATIVNNPLPSDTINTTLNVLKYMRPEGGEWWHSMLLSLNGYLGVGYPNSYLHFMMYNPNGSDFAVILRDMQGNEKVTDMTPRTVEGSEPGWMDYVIDLDENNFTNLNAVNFRMQNAGDYYIDEIMVNDDEKPRTGTSVGIATTESNPLVVYTSNGTITVVADDIASVDVYAVSGSLVAKKAANGATLIQVALPVGAYVVKAVLTNGETIARKVVL